MGAKAKTMISVVHRHLRHREQRVAVGQPAPDEDHRGAGRGGQQDQAGDVAVELVGRQPSARIDMADEHPAQQRHREGLHQPVYEQRHADAFDMLIRTSLHRAEIHLDQHRDDHHPDQQADRQIDARHFDPPRAWKGAGNHWPSSDAGDDAEENPEREPAFEHAHRCMGGKLGGDFALGTHCGFSSWMRRAASADSSRPRVSSGRARKASMRFFSDW
jgi:hypothetical protein